MKCEHCMALKTEGYEYPESYCGAGVPEEKMTADGCRLPGWAIKKLEKLTSDAYADYLGAMGTGMMRDACGYCHFKGKKDIWMSGEPIENTGYRFKFSLIDEKGNEIGFSGPRIVASKASKYCPVCGRVLRYERKED